MPPGVRALINYSAVNISRRPVWVRRPRRWSGLQHRQSKADAFCADPDGPQGLLTPKLANTAWSVEVWIQGHQLEPGGLA